MSQQRIQDYGSPVVAQSLKLLIDSITIPGILSGNEFIRDANNRLRINPGSCVTHQGVIIIEDEVKLLTINNTSNAVDYTVYYLHEDVDISGGEAAELVLDTGLLTSDVVKGCILGYIRYPGGGIPLEQSHFIQPPPLKIGFVTPTKENANWIFPIKNQGYLTTYTSGATLNITDTWTTYTPTGSTTPRDIMYVKIRNNGISTGVVTLTFPFKVNELPYSLFQMILSTDINALVTPTFVDSIGNSFTLGSGFTGQSEFLLKSETIPRTAYQTSNTVVYLQLMVSLAVGKEARIQALGLSPYNLPV